MSDALTQPERFRIESNSSVDLDLIATSQKELPFIEKKKGEAQLAQKVKELSELQMRLFAESSRSLLLIFQGMDAAGKDSAIRHIMTGVNPAGVEVCSYGVPSKDDLANSYLQRHWQDLPGRGYICIYNRSHYEEVIVTRVHTSLLSLRGVDPDTVDERFWQQRYEDIRAFERHLVQQNNTTVLKFFLHLSKDTQLSRLLKRIDDPSKRWKFDISDLRERLYWDNYHDAYNRAIAATSTELAPWYVIPADQKYFARLIIAERVVDALQAMDPQFPSPAANLANVRKELLKTA